MKSGICEVLFAEVQEWYRTLAETHGRIPRTLSGISDKGLQFIAIFDELELGHMEQLYLIKTALKIERSVVYAYAHLTATADTPGGPNEIELEVCVASRQQYITGYTTVSKDEARNTLRLGEWRVFRGTTPGTNLWTSLLIDDAVPAHETSRLQDIWKTLQTGMQYRHRRNP